jgi:hypothetical protein
MVVLSSLVHNLKMPLYILDHKEFAASESECELAVEIGTHGPDRTFDTVTPISTMVKETLPAIAFKVTEPNSQRLPSFIHEYLTSLGRGLLNI